MKPSVAIRLDVASNRDGQRVLQAIYRPSYRYTKAGVLCLELVPDDEKQASLLRPVDLEREQKERDLMAAADKLNLYYGHGTVRTAAAGYDGYKRKKGSKIHLAVDTLGHLLALAVTPTSAQEHAQVDALAQQV